MSLYNYLVKSDAPAQEIRYIFDENPQQIEQLYNRVKEIGYSGYLDFVQQHHEDILKYISLSESQRKQKKWVNNPDILLIQLAALQISRATVSFLRKVEPIADIVDFGSYRQFHSAVANALFPSMLYDAFSSFFQGFDNPFK